ncbi:hypothetical protein BN1723_001686 [Verticillium longisporum]|uniref:Uncharacterized protein n=2 Tax=Verticillium TaxID=1036719 RepID=A0A0G4KJZ2_VERLO|nr:hypothetical protein BJF96_g1664 [Verticillium dahliae]CRK06144.1 hypothetical protein BN1723_001686 [Verticillium longisporum]PNH42519.1 hypothetical protein VD0004_g4789 [Verticillium dahliae]PNH56536.1 hypothetical protein VD0003_g1167 [Verticillium dahliae]PNH66438.1 hypothetical protein VD0002_g2928 [Verticillium dahliae]
MQLSAVIVALFASVAFAAPSVIEARQDITCQLCRDDCFFSRGNLETCLGRCNADLGCNLTP